MLISDIFFKVVTDFTILQLSPHFLRRIWPFKSPSPQKAFVPSLGRICPKVLERKILKFEIAFSLFCNYLPFEKGLDLHLTKKWNPMHCAKFG